MANVHCDRNEDVYKEISNGSFWGTWEWEREES